MASSYKYFTKNDKVVGTNPLKEQVLNERSSSWGSSSNTPYYFVQYSSGSTEFALSKKVFDVTFGRSSDTETNSGSFLNAEQSVYNQFAKVLLGHESDSSIKKFNLGNNDSVGSILHNAYFVNFARSQFKDKISSDGTFRLVINVSGTSNVTLSDSGSTGVDLATCNAGTYGKLFVTSSNSGYNFVPDTNDVQGLVFYEAGIAVVSPYIFSKYSASSGAPVDTNLGKNEFGIISGDTGSVSGSYDISELVLSGTIADNCFGLTSRILTASYYSVTELNSTIYFCRAFNHEFNYSSNPTFLNGSEIVVKNGDPEALSRTYITTVGLYSDDNQLLAVAKLSEPILKHQENELIARVRIDF